MTDVERRFVGARCLQGVVLAMLLVTGAPRSDAVMDATTECLVEFADVPDADKTGGTIQCTDCDPSCDADGVSTPNGSCTFKLKVCVNDADATCAATELKKVKVTGKCGASVLTPVPSGSALTCGTEGNLTVKTKKKGKKPGKCKVTSKALSSSKPRRVDKDMLTLVCNPRPSGDACPAPTTSTLPGSTTTTTSTVPASCVTVTTHPPSACAPIVIGQQIENTYKLQGTTGEKRCVTNSANVCNGGSRAAMSCTTDDTNATTGCPGATCPSCCVPTRFNACTTDADCGGISGACLDLPWVTADGQVMPFPTGESTTFTVAEAGAFPACEHSVCIPCGNPNAACAGLPGCAVAGNPNGCIPRATQGCCDQPAFIVPTFFVNILGGLCSRVDQYDCGVGVINTSNPQTGDNEVSKTADTSDPGADCCYNGHPGSECIGGVNLNDDPAPLACSPTQAGGDLNGKIIRTVGNGSPDANGIQYRFTTPEVSTTWFDGQSPSGMCVTGSTYDDGETLVSQLLLKAEPTTAGATGSFTDQNGDGCKRAGAGFISNPSPATDGPITVGPAPGGPARPQPYDGSAGSVAAAVSEVFTGSGSPIHDIGFVAVTPNMPVVVAPPRCCTCSATPGCPE